MVTCEVSLWVAANIILKHQKMAEQLFFFRPSFS
jgi:hypothetical protein